MYSFILLCSFQQGRLWPSVNDTITLSDPYFCSFLLCSSRFADTLFVDRGNTEHWMRKKNARLT